VVLIAPSAYDVHHTFATVIHRDSCAMFFAFFKAFEKGLTYGFPP
jgi:hypothetical protein